MPDQPETFGDFVKALTVAFLLAVALIAAAYAVAGTMP